MGVSVRHQTVTAFCAPIPTAVGLAFRLGELPVDFRRRGHSASIAPELNALTLRIGGETYSIQWGGPHSALPLLSQGRIAIGLSLQHLKEFILVPPDSRLRSAEDLAGARIGIPAEDESARAEAANGFAEALRSAGSDLSRATPADLPIEPSSADAGSALARKLAQALLLGEADAVYANGSLALGLQEIVGARPIWSRQASYPLVFWADEKLVRLHPESVDRVLAHVLAASSWAKTHREAAHRLLAKEIGLSEPALEVVYGESLHAELDLGTSADRIEAFNRHANERMPGGFLRGTFDIAGRLDPTRLRCALELVTQGLVEPPSGEGVSPYALAPVPDSFFLERKAAHVIGSDEEAIAVARQIAAQIKEGASERDRDRRLPFDELKLLGESGLLGLMVPKAYGGPGVSVRTLTEIFKIISAADGAIGQIPQNHHFFVRSVELVGTEEQKAFFFAEVLRGAQFGNALAERGIKGFKEMTTRLKRANGGGYRLSGSKYYATGALFSHWIPVTALDEEEKRVTAFVPRDAEGVAVIDDWSGIGQRTTASGSVVFHDVAVPADRVLPHWRIFEKPQTFGAFGQIMHAAIDVGIAQAALEDAAWFVREKARPLFRSGYTRASEEPDLIRRFGELGIRLQAADALLERAAAAIDRAEQDLNETTAGQATLAVDTAKYFAAEASVEIANALFEVSGTSSMDRKYNFDRHWRNVRIHTLHDPARLKLHNVGNWYLNGVYHEYKI